MARRTAGARRGRRQRKNIPSGQAHIHATFNNTIITITDQKGNTVNWTSAGATATTGARQSTPHAAQAAIRSPNQAGLQVTSITDVTQIPHNGCRPRKKRRV